MQLKDQPEDFKVYEIPSLSLTPKGNHLVFRLKKKEWNTEDAVQEIIKRLNIPRKNIGYSGSKDRHAVTEQYISIIGTDISKVENLKIKDIELEYVGRTTAKISLGEHSGNRFEIVVKEADGKPRKIDRMVNYFGEQRFSGNNEEIGKAMIKGDFEKACKLMEHETVKQYLENKPNDFVGAIKTIPENTATLYIHSYQSKLWNKAAKILSGGENREVPIVGYSTKFKDPEIKKTYSQILKEEGITKRNFIIRPLPHISAQGSSRLLYTPVEDLKLEELGSKEWLVKFSLPSGSYATEAIKQIFGQ